MHILAFIQTRSKGINFCKTFRIWIECESQKFLFSLDQENTKKVLRVVELEIRFHRYETQIKSFQVQKTLLKIVLYTYTTPLLLPAAILAPASTIF